MSSRPTGPHVSALKRTSNLGAISPSTLSRDFSNVAARPSVLSHDPPGADVRAAALALTSSKLLRTLGDPVRLATYVPPLRMADPRVNRSEDPEAGRRGAAGGCRAGAANVELSALTCLKRRSTDVTDNKSRVSVCRGDSQLEENESVGNEDGRDGSLSAITSRWSLVASPSVNMHRGERVSFRLWSGRSCTLDGDLQLCKEIVVVNQKTMASRGRVAKECRESIEMKQWGARGREGALTFEETMNGKSEHLKER